MADTSPVQLVDADGEFCIAKIDEFAGTSGLLSSGLKYQIVAIMGPQSSGKSTLMNHVVRGPVTLDCCQRVIFFSLGHVSRRWMLSLVDVKPLVGFGWQRHLSTRRF